MITNQNQIGFTTNNYDLQRKAIELSNTLQILQRYRISSLGIWADAYYYANTLIQKLIFESVQNSKTDPNEGHLYVECTKKSYAETTCPPEAALKNMLMSSSNRNNQNSKDRCKLIIYYIPKRHTILFEHLDAYEEIKELRKPAWEAPLTVEAGMTIRVYEYENTVTIFTNQKSDALLRMAFGMLPVFFESVKEAAENDLVLYCLLACHIQYNEELMRYIIEYYCNNINDARQARILAKLTSALSNTANKQKILIEREIENLQKTVEQNINYNRNYLNQIKTKQATLFAMEIQGSEDFITPFLQFIKNCKGLRIRDINQDYLYTTITTPVRYYHTSDVEAYFKRDVENSLNDKGWFANLIKDTFIEEKYKLIFTTNLDLPLNPDVNSSFYVNQDTGYIANPHMLYYNCFTQAKSQYWEALRNQNLVLCVNTMIAACASLTFTDATVISRFAGLIRAGDNHTVKCFIDNEGNEFSAKEYKTKWLEEHKS